MSRRKFVTATTPYGYNPDISVYEELPFGKDTIKYGDKVRIKNRRGVFVFHKWAHNAHLDVSWIDCLDAKTGEFRSFYIHDLKSVVRPKRSIRKKLV